MPRNPWGQFKARTHDVILAEEKAIALLNEHLGKSIEEAVEYGGVLYIEGSECHTTGPFHGDRAEPTVKIHQYDPNCGCPTGTKPIGYWHTHPRLSGAGQALVWDHFEGPDVDIAVDYSLHGYIGAVDGRLIWYDWTEKKEHTLNGVLRNTTD